MFQRAKRVLSATTSAMSSSGAGKFVEFVDASPSPFHAVATAVSKLEAAGFEVSDAVDHGTMWSIYFFDPNGHRLEVATDIGTPTQLAELKRVSRDMLDEWSRTKKAPSIKHHGARGALWGPWGPWDPRP